MSTPVVTRPTALISLPNLRHNLTQIRGAISATTKLCAVLKADAYGHGAAAIAREVAGSGARRQPLVDAVAVATFEEAEVLGRMAVPLYVLRPIDALGLSAERARLEEGIRLGWILAVNSVAAARELARVAQSMRVPALVQLAVDTGMARAGIPVEHFADVAGAVAMLPGLRLVSLSTHFVSSEDAQSGVTSDQFQAFKRATDTLALNLSGVTRHAANSGAVFLHPTTHLDMVRPGKAIYGLDPAGEATAGRDLRPILKWVAPLMMVRELKRGESVGYGATFTAPADMRLGLVSVGFADGYMRCLSNRGVMRVRGHEAPVVGRVSMDYVTIDVTRVPEVSEGDEVTILDDDARSPAGIYNVARLAGTIPSEVLCGIGARVPRVAVGSQLPGVAELGPRIARERGRRVRAAG